MRQKDQRAAQVLARKSREAVAALHEGRAVGGASLRLRDGVSAEEDKPEARETKRRPRLPRRMRPRSRPRPRQRRSGGKLAAEGPRARAKSQRHRPAPPPAYPTRMRHRKIIIAGPVGAGKTTAICSVSEIEPIVTDARASDDTRQRKEMTTVVMDDGRVPLCSSRRSFRSSTAARAGRGISPHFSRPFALGDFLGWRVGRFQVVGSPYRRGVPCTCRCAHQWCSCALANSQPVVCDVLGQRSDSADTAVLPASVLGNRQECLCHPEARALSGRLLCLREEAVGNQGGRRRRDHSIISFFGSGRNCVRMAPTSA